MPSQKKRLSQAALQEFLNEVGDSISASKIKSQLLKELRQATTITQFRKGIASLYKAATDAESRKIDSFIDQYPDLVVLLPTGSVAMKKKSSSRGRRRVAPEDVRSLVDDLEDDLSVSGAKKVEKMLKALKKVTTITQFRKQIKALYASLSNGDSRIADTTLDHYPDLIVLLPEGKVRSKSIKKKKSTTKGAKGRRKLYTEDVQGFVDELEDELPLRSTERSKVASSLRALSEATQIAQFRREIKNLYRVLSEAEGKVVDALVDTYPRLVELL